jgi:xanthine dehydrogenase accessory factor
MIDLLPDIERWQHAGKKVAVATVVQAYGSAPRRAGAKMAISEDGEFVGSVSGGCVENDVVEHARQVLEDDYPRLVPYGISDEMAFNVGLACGGQIEVFIQPFERPISTDNPVAFAYVVDGDNLGEGLLASENGSHRGSLGQGDALDAYPAPPTIVIFGGVHIGVALARVAKLTGGFRVAVVDARGAWATPERFEVADEIHVMHADDYLRGHPLTSSSFVAVLSHDPKLDDPALFGALQSQARYVGAIGSPKTQRERRERLKTAGISAEQLDRLQGPIGLDIGAQTPEEIAVAILAQMIAAKNGKLLGATLQPRVTVAA